MPTPALAVVAAATFGTMAVSRIRASHRDGIAVRRHSVPWKGERRVRVVHLTDLHVGLTTPTYVLDRVAEVVHTLSPDVVVLTGDYVNGSLFFANRLSAFIAKLPRPCVATLGNHDHWSDAGRVSWALRASGAKVLQNATTTIGEGDRRLVIVGVDDGGTKHDDVDRAFLGVDAPDRALVLTHNPNTARAIATKGAPLVLAGHTHAGQIDVPRATTFVSKLAGHSYLRGFHRVSDATEVYVNAGLGHSLPGLRGGRTCPEIAVFDLDPTANTRTSCELRAGLSRDRRARRSGS